MILPLRRKHRTTAQSTLPATARSQAWAAGAWRAALAVAFALATTPAWADFQPSADKSATADASSSSADTTATRTANAKPAAGSNGSAKNLKWRAAKTDASANDASSSASSLRTDDVRVTTVDRSPAEVKPLIDEKPLVEEKPSSAKSVIKISIDKRPTVTKSNDKEPVEFKSAPLARPIKTARLRRGVSVERLSEASPSPHSSDTYDSDASSLKILKTSNEEPKIDPFGEDLPTPPVAKAKKRERAVRAALQEPRGGREPDPFGDNEPRLEQVMPSQPPLPLPEDELTQAPNALPNACPTPKEYVKKLADISTNIAAEPGEFPVECGLGDEQFVPRDWQNMIFAWKASALCHKPLYFEDVQLERYGQTPSPLFQPLLSAARFYLVLPALPYMMGLEPPCECIYPLGYYRPGSCAPFIIPPVPISLRGALLEAGVWVAGVALVP
jgi:hypothetical protein